MAADLICWSMLIRRWLIGVGSQMPDELIRGWKGCDLSVSVQVASWWLMVCDVSTYACLYGSSQMGADLICGCMTMGCLSSASSGSQMAE